MSATAFEKQGRILVIVTLDTKQEESTYLCRKIRDFGCIPVVMDTGAMGEDKQVEGRWPDIPRREVAQAGGLDLSDPETVKDKGKCIAGMMAGAEAVTLKLYSEGAFDGVVSIGGAQGTDIATAAMRALPFGVPKVMVSTVANGKAMFGPYIGTRDICIMHSVVDILGINKITATVFTNAASAVCGMVQQIETIEQEKRPSGEAGTVAMSMLGTTTVGAMHIRDVLEADGYEVVAFHQNGVGGIAMEDMIREGSFAGILDLNLHEIGDRVAGGLHGAIRDYRIDSAAQLGIPMVVAPGSINYTVQGPLDSLSEEMKSRKYIVHNPNLTLVRLSKEELLETADIVAEKLNRATGPVRMYVPLQGFSAPDKEGFDHWDPELNQLFIDRLKNRLDDSIPYKEIDAHINDQAFIDAVVTGFREIMEEKKQ